jgi:lipocalin
VLKQEIVWILSRARTLSNETIENLKAILKKNGIGAGSKLIVTDQSTCN